jgi:hypothetical protein
MLLDKLLEKFGLKWDDLDTPGHSGEREYLLQMVSSIEQKQVTVQTIREHIANMKSVVEQRLINEPEFNYIFIFKVPNRKQILLKARLENYLLLESMLSSPEKAQKAVEAQLLAISKNKI